MTREVSAEVIIDLPLDDAWEKLRDISLAHNYVPGIVKTEIVSDQAEGVAGAVEGEDVALRHAQGVHGVAQAEAALRP